MDSTSQETLQIIASRKAQYTRLIDTKEWSQLDAILLPNFTFRMVDPEGAIMKLEGTEVTFSTREQWKRHFSELLKCKQITHLVGFPELEQAGPDEITAVFAMQSFSADTGICHGRRTALAGHYRDIWRKVDGEWCLGEVALKLTYFTFDQ